jgi:hypothetical protein
VIEDRKHEEHGISNKETKTKRRTGRPKESFVDKAKGFGFVLRRERARRGMTQPQMGELMKVNGGAVPSKVVISRWENGINYPQRRNIDRFKQISEGAQEWLLKQLAI